jgi:hypothetical protein
MQRKRRQGGFVLLMVLAVLVLAATVLAAAASRSCRSALEAAEAQRDLQRRWGALSAKAAVLPRAELLLAQEEARLQRPAVSTRWELELGNVPLVLALSDEQAKANVNLLEARHGRQSMVASLSRLQSGSSALLPVRPRPQEIRRVRGQLAPPRYESFDMLFEVQGPWQLVGADGRTASVERITCWSDGRINFGRADRESLRTVTRGILNEAELAKLLEFRRDVPGGSVHEALKRLELPRERAVEAARLLTNGSQCHALWVVSGDSGERHYRLYIGRGEGAAGSEWRFAW